MAKPEEGTATSPDAPAESPDNDLTAGGCLVFVALLVLVAGLLSLAAGGVLAHVGPSKPDPDNVRCGDAVMVRGDTCIAFGGGPEDGGSYREVADQQRRQAHTHDVNHRRASAAMRTGGVLVAIALGLYVLGYLALKGQERRRRGATGRG